MKRHQQFSSNKFSSKFIEEFIEKLNNKQNKKHDKKWMWQPARKLVGHDLEQGGIQTDQLEENKSEQGSAVTEFVLIATPLFIPALLFFNAIHSTATEEINVSHIARQAVRAFATAPDLSTGHQRVKFVLDKFSELENRGTSNRYEFTYNISCGAEGCLTPGSLIELELYRRISPVLGVSDSENRKSKAVARTYVDKWRPTQ